MLFLCSTVEGVPGGRADDAPPQGQGPRPVPNEDLRPGQVYSQVQVLVLRVTTEEDEEDPGRNSPV